MAFIQFGEILMIAPIVAIGMFFSIVIAAIIGSLMPMIFQKFKIDPAIATGPFVSTMIDNVGLLGYLASCILLIK